MDGLLNKPVTSDPKVVKNIVGAIIDAIDDSTNDDTSMGEVLSALFTALDHTLAYIASTESPEERAHNSKEIGRVLSKLLMEFGSETLN